MECDNGILSRKRIVENARAKWDAKTSEEKLSSGRKYRHIFERLSLPSSDWNSRFSELSRHQASILIKGELIRTYDTMPNSDKTRVKRRYGLTTFSSKWYRLPSVDKKTLLNSILRE